MANRKEKVEAVTDFIFFGSKITVDGFCSECTHGKKKKTHKNHTLADWKESYYKPKQHIKKKRQHFSNKGLYSQSYGF